MRLAFLMPCEAERHTTGRLRESVLEMRPDQIDHLGHLLRSWRVFGSDAPHVVWRAIKRTLRDRP